MNASCPICQNQYGSNANDGNVIPVTFKCCFKGACSDCAEKHRAAKISELVGNKKKIPCMFCREEFHSCSNKQWAPNETAIQLLGIDVDGRPSGVIAAESRSPTGSTNAGVRSNDEEPSTIEENGRGGSARGSGQLSNDTQTCHERTREVNSNNVAYEFSTNSATLGDIRNDSGTGAGAASEGQASEDERTMNVSNSGNNDSAPTLQSRTRTRRSSTHLMGDATNSYTDVDRDSLIRVSVRVNSASVQFRLLQAMTERSIFDNESVSSSSQATIPNGVANASFDSAGTDEAAANAIFFSGDDALTLPSRTAVSSLVAERDFNRVWKNVVNNLKEKLRLDEGGFYRVRQFYDADTESDPCSRKTPFWCIKTGCIFTSPSIVWATSQDGSTPDDLDAAKNYIRSLSPAELKDIIETYHYYAERKNHIPTDRIFIELSPGDIVAMSIKGDAAKGLKAITAFGVIEDSDDLIYLSPGELNPPHNFPIDFSNRPSMVRGFLTRKVKWLRHGETSKIKGRNKNGNWLAECSPVWLVEVGSGTVKHRDDAMRKMSSEHFLKNTEPITDAWINSELG